MQATMLNFLQAVGFSNVLATAPIFMSFRNIAKSDYWSRYVSLSVSPLQ
jgi:hypothetical protein